MNVNQAAASIIMVLFIVLVIGYGKQDRALHPAKIKIQVPRYTIIIVQLSTVISLTFGLTTLLIQSPVSLQLFSGPFPAITGVTLCAAGLILTLTAKVQLGDSYSPCFNSYVPEKIVCHGIYRFLKHPIYIGNVIFSLGVFISSGSLAVLLSTLVLSGLYIKIAAQEDKALNPSS